MGLYFFMKYNHILGPFQEVFHENRDFSGGKDFFGPLNGHKRQRGAILRPKSRDPPLKSLDLQGKSQKMALVCDLPK